MNLEKLARLYTAHVAHLQGKYEEALAGASYDALVIHSGALKRRTDFDDQYWPLRATPHFQHWLPLDEPECALVVAYGKKPKLVWLRDGSFWEKPAAPETDHWLRAFDIVHVTTPEEADEHLPKKRAAFVGEERLRGEAWGFAMADVNPKGLVERLDQLRVKKTPYEVMCLEEANRRAARGHDAVARAFRAGDASELELHLLYLRVTGQDDPETPYKNIVAIGENAATLHHIKYGRHSPGAPGSQALLLDAGATFQGYCSDITRTFVKGSGAASSTFASLVDNVERFQKKLCTDVAVGNKYEALHVFATAIVREILREDGPPQSFEVVGPPAPAAPDERPPEPRLDFDASNLVCEHGGMYFDRELCPVHGPGAQGDTKIEDLDTIVADVEPDLTAGPIARARRMAEQRAKAAGRERLFPEDLPMRGMSPPEEIP